MSLRYEYNLTSFRHGPLGMPVLAGYCLIFITPLIIIWLTAAFALDNKFIATSFAAGFEAYFLLCGLSLFSGRPMSKPNWDGNFFIAFHRFLAFILVSLIFTHVFIFVAAEPIAAPYLTPDAPWYMLAGQIGAVAVLLCVSTSFSLSSIKTMYATIKHFKQIHRLFFVSAVGLSAVHIIAAHDHVRSRVAETLIEVSAAAALATPMLRRQAMRYADILGKRRARRKRMPVAFPARLAFAFLASCLALAVSLAILPPS